MAFESALSSTSNTSANFEFLFNEQKDDQKLILEAVTSSNGETLFTETKKQGKQIDVIAATLKSSNEHLMKMSEAITSGAVEHTSQILVDIAASGSSVDFVRAMESIAQLDDIGILTTAEGLDQLAMKIDLLAGKSYDKIGDGLSKFGDGLNYFAENIPTFKVFAGVAGGIALLGLSIAGFAMAVDFTDILVFGAAVTAIALTADRLEGTHMGMVNAAAGIATLGLAIWAFGKLVTGEALLTTVLGLLAMGTALRFFNKSFGKDIKEAGTSVLILAGATAALGLSLLVYEAVEWESVAKMGASLAAIGLFGIALDKAKFGINDALAVGILAGSVALLGFGVSMFNDISAETVMVALGALAGVGIAAVLLGKVGKNAILGALTIAAMGVSMGVLAWGLGQIKDLDLTWEDAGVIAATIGLTAGAFALLGIPAVAGLIVLGSVAAAAVGVGLAAMAFGLNQIKTVDVTEEEAKTFGMSVARVKDAIISLGNPADTLMLGLGVANAALITAATIPLTLTMAALSAVNVPDESKVNSFMIAVTGLKDAYLQFGLLETAKLAVVSPLVALMAASTIAVGGAINLFTKLSTNPDAVTESIGSVDAFISGMSSTFSQFSVEDFMVMERGISATRNLGKLLRGLAFGISAIGQEIKNGTDFNAIGQGVGSMLTALTEPLANIGSQQEEITVAGFKFTNPFSNKVQEGIEAMQGLSGVFGPISEIIKVFAQENSQSVVESFSSNLTTILSGISQSFGSLDPEAINMETVSNVGKLTNHISNLMAKLGDNEDGQAAARNMKSIASSAHDLKAAVNEMDLDKLSKLDSMMYNLGQISESDNFDDLIEVLMELSRALKGVEGGDTTVTENNTTATTTDSAAKKTEVKSQDDEDSITQLASSNSEGFEMLSKKIEKLVNTMLTGQVKVQIKQAL